MLSLLVLSLFYAWTNTSFLKYLKVNVLLSLLVLSLFYAWTTLLF